MDQQKQQHHWEQDSIDILIMRERNQFLFNMLNVVEPKQSEGNKERKIANQ